MRNRLACRVVSVVWAVPVWLWVAPVSAEPADVAPVAVPATAVLEAAPAAASSVPIASPEAAQQAREALSPLPEPGADGQYDSPLWQKIRKAMFQDRPIETAQAADWFDFQVPARAEDAAVVPVAISARSEQKADHVIRRMWLIVDRNPSPVGVRLTLTPESGRASIETRIRVEQYSPIRVVAETGDGRLLMRTRFIKASGGCSAPAAKDAAAARAGMGRMRLRLDGQPVSGKPILAQVMISHPNDSGMVMDQLTRTFAPAHFVRSVEVLYAGQPVLTADIDFTISENPNFRFWFRPDAAGELSVRAVDNEDLEFRQSIAVRPAGAA